MSDKCKACDKNITARVKAKILCNDCRDIFHGNCVNLSQEDIDFISTENSIWRCDSCQNTRRQSLRLETSVSETTVSSEILNYLKDMRKESMEQMKRLEIELGKSVENCHEKIADLIKLNETQSETLKAYEMRFEELKRENSELKSKVKTLEARLDDSEQYSRINCLEINGIPEANNENVMEVIRNVAAKLDVTVTDNDIDACHRLGIKQEGRSRGIIVKFTRRSVKEEILQRRKVKRNFNTSDIGITDKPAEVIYINESLSLGRRKLLKAARDLKRDKHFTYVWVKNGKVFVRKNEGDKAIVLTDIEQVVSLYNK